MFEKARKHHAFADPRERGGSVESRPWLPERGGEQQPSSSFSSGSPPRAPPHLSASGADPGNGDSFDKVLFRNLVEMVPLVESLMDKRSNSSFTRRASMIYTPAPANERKTSATKNRKTAQSVSTKSQRETSDNSSSNSSVEMMAQEDIRRDRAELISLKEQVADLQNKLLEKDEALKSMEDSLNHMNSVRAIVDELKHQVEEKDSMIKSAISQLSSLKIKLADKQAALEKFEWEAKTSNQKVEQLQGSWTLSNMKSVLCFRQDVDEDGMEEARRDYMAAIATAKENPTEETLCAAAEARQRLQAFVL
ncbi:unnamed protein product [Spirodela intermedia]|uniref:Uncharacterized protein n=1 Tax=Spirodela intermedia TaxID=51605 RepID=A0A7I8JKV9_SPIIN|nr:unnamed protein product [Spirodela intermedia]CAA6670690.1 unnamed protein product [Spirodela intermedia]